MSEHAVHPTERDRLRSLITASHYTGDLWIDKVLWWYADESVGIFLEAAVRAGFDTQTVRSFEEFCEVETMLRGPEAPAEVSAKALWEGAVRAGLDPLVIQRFEEHARDVQRPKEPESDEVDDCGA